MSAFFDRPRYCGGAIYIMSKGPIGSPRYPRHHRVRRAIALPLPQAATAQVLTDDLHCTATLLDKDHLRCIAAQRLGSLTAPVLPNKSSQ